MRIHRLIAAGACLVLMLGVPSLRGRTQDVRPAVPPLGITSLAGSDLFNFYCASCHGRGGKGDGPVVSALRMRPPDLTLLARHNSGIFPTARVAAAVGGDGRIMMSAHGSTEMPVWGPIFRALDGRDTLAGARVASLVTYVQGLQVK